MKDKQSYHIGWLLPEDAPEVALLEARVHAAEHCAGEASIRGLFEETECSGRNLSLGVYHLDPAAPAGRRLVGFLLVFVLRSRREAGEFFDAPIPSELDPAEPAIYVADWVFEADHRRAATLPVEKLAGIVAADEVLRHLSVDAFSTPAYASKWQAQRRWFGRQGLRLVGSYPYHDAKLDRPMFWVHCQRVPEALPPPNTPEHAPLTCRLVTDLWQWAELKLVWDRLLEASPERTPWQSYAYLTQWWRHLSSGMLLRIFVVERAGQPCLVLPMQIAHWDAIPGAPVRMLEPIGTIMDVNRPRLALGKPDEAAYRCALDFIFRRDDWDVIRIDEKPWDDPEIALLRDYGLEHECLFRQIFSHLVPFLDLHQSWDSFLQARSQKLRKNLKAARRKLEARGPVVLRSYETEPEVLEAFGVMLELHERSWKHKLEVEHSRSEGYPEFYTNWVEHMAELGQCRILILYCGDSPVAATIAFIDRGTYYSAQIVHDAEFAACSPGTLLEAMELELLMKEGRYDTYDMLGSFLNNKLRWTDTAMKSAHALVLRRRLRTFLMDAYFFLVKPYLRPAVAAVYRRLRPKQS